MLGLLPVPVDLVNFVLERRIDHLDLVLGVEGNPSPVPLGGGVFWVGVVGVVPVGVQHRAVVWPQRLGLLLQVQDRVYVLE